MKNKTFTVELEMDKKTLKTVLHLKETMKDETQTVRQIMTTIVNASVESLDNEKERQRLTKEYGPVWNTQELQNDFEVLGFMAPFVIVRNRNSLTNEKGTLMFQHSPRFYFNYRKD